jgi:hypothetical protein
VKVGGGKPYLTLSNGGKATYSAGSGTNALGPVYIGYSGRDSQAPETLIQGWKMEVSLDSHGIEQRPMATDCT